MALALGAALVFASLSVARAADSVAGAPLWFNVTGNPANERDNTIEVDPVPVSVGPEGRVMNIRVSRSTSRRNWEGAPYRSYTARVRFNCAAGNAVYTYAEFYDQPLWQGTPSLRTDYTKGPPRKMLFLDVDPNPTQRIVRAACSQG